jgi:hypothetical protein
VGKRDGGEYLRDGVGFLDHVGLIDVRIILMLRDPNHSTLNIATVN